MKSLSKKDFLCLEKILSLSVLQKNERACCKKRREKDNLSPPREDTVRRCPFVNQEDSFLQETNWPAPWSWTAQPSKQ